MDTVGKKTRSRIMASVGQRDTGLEMQLRKALHRRGLRYRLHDRKLPGSPDLVFSKFKAVIFVHGCFWHAHGCKYSTTPSTRRRFWLKKFKDNRKRDRRNMDLLRAAGWRVLVVWGCAIGEKSRVGFDGVLKLIVDWLNSEAPYGEIGSDG